MEDNIHGTLTTPPVLTPWGYFPSHRVSYDESMRFMVVSLNPNYAIVVQEEE